jgi:hypothetical protein
VSPHRIEGIAFRGSENLFLREIGWLEIAFETVQKLARFDPLLPIEAVAAPFGNSTIEGIIYDQKGHRKCTRRRRNRLVATIGAR